MEYVVYFRTFIQLQVEFLGLFYVSVGPILTREKFSLGKYKPSENQVKTITLK
jgi:hypothetical protein